MDKLELDARMARVERRVSFLFALAILGLLVVGLGLGLVALRGRHVAAAQTAQMEAIAVHTLPPTPMAPPALDGMAMTAYDNPFGAGGMGMLGPLGETLRQLVTIRQLLVEKVITPEDWEAKKAQLLAGPIAAANLRNDLQAVQQLWETKALNDAERDALKQQLLGLSKPGEAPATDAIDQP